MKQLRNYQIDNAKKGVESIKLYNFVYFAMQVRTGKTVTALETSRLLSAKNVLFLTKKKAIGYYNDEDDHAGVIGDYMSFDYDDHFMLVITNYESMHKLPPEKYDVIIVDESHCLSAFPKLSQRAKALSKLTMGVPVIALSGTPSPESFSQLFHQMVAVNKGPWLKYKNFYEWAKAGYVDIKSIKIMTHTHNDYSNGVKDKILDDIKPYMIAFTQKDAGFASTISEHVDYVKMKDSTYALAKRLIKDKVVEKGDRVILGDLPAKLQSKVHQIFSGTVLFESGEAITIDDSKIKFIEQKYSDKKLAIFYQYKHEYTALKEFYGDKLTNDINEFNVTDKHIALQFVSGREGTNLSKADLLIMYNIAFSATTYWQSRDRMTTLDRIYNKIIWIFAEGGIEDKIHSAVKRKMKYTSALFKKDLLNW